MEEEKVVPVMVRCQSGIKVFFGYFIPNKFKGELMTTVHYLRMFLGFTDRFFDVADHSYPGAVVSNNRK